MFREKNAPAAKGPPKNSTKPWQGRTLGENEEEEDLADSGRLFVRNLPYTSSEEDLEKIFSRYGRDAVARRVAHAQSAAWGQAAGLTAWGLPPPAAVFSPLKWGRRSLSRSGDSNMTCIAELTVIGHVTGLFCCLTQTLSLPTPNSGQTGFGTLSALPRAVRALV